MKKSGPFTVDTVWNPSTGGSATEPGLTVTGRVDGEAYTVSAGARSLTISNPDGATLSTTVELASDGSSVAVTGATTTSPSWTAPSGGTIGEAVQVQVTATKDGLTSQVSFTERVAGSNYTALVAAADPSDVSLSGGSTSSSGSPRTFTNPTGGSGSYTLAVTSTQLDGTGATLQGNNSTGYYIDSLEDGDTVEVIGSFSDDTTGQVVKNRFVVTVAVTVYTEPSIIVAGRVDGEAYTVSSGARSLTITNTDSATLLTTVEKASDGTAISVTGSATTTPSWTAPTGGASGESYQVLVTATKNSLSSSVAFTERVAADTAPSLSVTGRVDGEAYNVTAGARSLSITTDAGATLSTTVELASDGSSVAVTGSTTTTPSWTAPAEGDFGDAYQVKVASTKGGLSSKVSFTERMAGTPAIPVVNTILDIDWQQLWIDNGSVDVDLSVNGTYTIAGDDYIVDRSTTGQTVTLKSTGLELVQTSGVSMDWSIAFGTSLHANAGDNKLLTADMTSTISSALSGSSIGAAAVIGYSQSPNWGSQPIADWVGAGWDINGSTSQDLVCIVRGVARYVDTDRQSPKVNPTSSNHRLYVNGSTYGAAHNPSAAFDGTTLKPVGAVYTAGNSDGFALFPPANRYGNALYCSLWAVGGTGTQMVWTVTRSTWRAWPVPK